MPVQHPILLSVRSKLLRNNLGRCARIARCDLAAVKVLFRADKPIWAWLLRHAGWQINRYKPKGTGMKAHKQAFGEHHTHEIVPYAEIVLVRFQSRHIVVCKEENVGTRATLCSSRVFGLVEVICRTNTSFSRLEVAYFRERFDDWDRLVDTMPDFSIR